MAAAVPVSSVGLARSPGPALAGPGQVLDSNQVQAGQGPAWLQGLEGPVGRIQGPPGPWMARGRVLPGPAGSSRLEPARAPCPPNGSGRNWRKRAVFRCFPLFSALSRLLTDSGGPSLHF